MRGVSGDAEASGPHGSPGDAKHGPETREDALLTMRSSIFDLDCASKPATMLTPRAMLDQL
jgi:hypothetical protein